MPAPGSAVPVETSTSLQANTPELRRRVRLRLTLGIVGANVVGAGVVVALGLVALPLPAVRHGAARWATVAVLPAYVVLAVALGIVLGTRRSLQTLRWAEAEVVPTPAQAQRSYGIPLRLSTLQAGLWLTATALFTSLYATSGLQSGLIALFTTSLGGAVVCAFTYLISEEVLRPIFAFALAVREPDRPSTLRARTLLGWALGSATPTVGLMLTAGFSLGFRDVTRARLAVAVLALGVVVLVFGLLMTALLGRATVATLGQVRQGMQAVAGGDLTRTVVVNDRTELGELQGGFNAMATGLQERERVRDLFGRHVGESVAAAALASRPQLGGITAYAATVFVDVVASTAMAESRPPAQVVETLNRMFAVVVSTVEAHGGLVNKFLGDAALAIFGAPLPLEDPDGAALRCARALCERLAAELPELRVGIGAAAGDVVAGNLGSAERFEYTVIGDPVNVAARLSDLAKTRSPSLLVTTSMVERTHGDDGSQYWRSVGELTLRGRSQPVPVSTAVTPADDPANFPGAPA